MEEEKAAAYYDELTRKGSAAARFKQGLGFSSAGDGSRGDDVPARGSAIPSFLSSFVKASSPSNSSDVAQKQVQIESIQNKLKKKPNSSSSSRVSDRSDRDRDRNNSDIDRDRDRYRYRDRDYRDRDRGRRERSRSGSPRRYRSSEKRRDDDYDDRKSKKEKAGGVGYVKLIQGYDKMSPAERVKAKMKLQLSATAKQDEANGMGSGWERFNFDKDAPLDDEEIEAGDDDRDLVKHIGQTFRLSAVEARREEKIKATHDEAIFGSASLASPVDTDSKAEGNNQTRESPEAAPVPSIISDQALSLQQGSWRDRIRKA